MSKYAVFTMDVEAFSDTECIRASGNRTEEELLDGFDRYISLLDRYGIKSTLFTVGRLAPQMTDRLRRCIRKGHRLALHRILAFAIITTLLFGCYNLLFDNKKYPLSYK